MAICIPGPLSFQDLVLREADLYLKLFDFKDSPMFILAPQWKEQDKKQSVKSVKAYKFFDIPKLLSVFSYQSIK